MHARQWYSEFFCVALGLFILSIIFVPFGTGANKLLEFLDLPALAVVGGWVFGSLLIGLGPQGLLRVAKHIVNCPVKAIDNAATTIEAYQLATWNSILGGILGGGLSFSSTMRKVFLHPKTTNEQIFDILSMTMLTFTYGLLLTTVFSIARARTVQSIIDLRADQAARAAAAAFAAREQADSEGAGEEKS